MRTIKPAASVRAEQEDPVSQQKRVKKRMQNRNAQRSHREKQAAYIRTLEKMVGDAVLSSGAVPLRTAQTQANWVEEIRELQDALLRMRRRFQALSLTATSNAEDRIFQKILNRESVPHEEPACILARHEQADSPNNEPCTEFTANSGSTPTIDWGEDAELAALFSADYLHGNARHSDAPCPRPKISGPVAVRPCASINRPTCALAAVFQPTSFESLHLEDVYNSTDILGVEKTVTAALAQSSDIDVEKSVSLAVRIMLKRSSLLEGFFSIMGGLEAIERIIHWRIAPTPANRNKIPSPFRPTILQQYSTNRHHCIDFLIWDELRDQMLLQNDIDLCQLAEDCLKDLVQDVPQLNLSVPLVETYCHLIQLAQSTGEQRAYSPVERFLDLTGSEDILQSVHSYPQYKVFRAVERYKLDSLSGRRLAPRFAEKYPSLDVTSILTQLPVASFG